MNRCVSILLALALAALAPAIASAQSAQQLGPFESPQATQAAPANKAAQAAALAALLASQSAQTSGDGQSVQRNFPQKALRGDVVFGTPPFIRLDGNVTQMAAAYRVHGFNNLLLMSTQLVGVEGVVDFTMDANGQVYEVWILTPAEAAKKPWPRTPAETAAWSFDPIAQAWTKP